MKESRSFVLQGKEAGDWLGFEFLPEISDQSYTITAAFHGYTVVESSVTLSGIGQFLEQLSDFETARKATARLSGSYDFVMSVAPYECRGAAFVAFDLSHYLWLANGRQGRCRLDGGFIVEGEHVGAMVAGLRRLLLP